jgi:hypothetical protein
MTDRSWLLSLLPALLFVSETAQRPDGRELPGALTLGPGGRLRFEAKEKTLSAADLALVRFDGPAPAPWRSAGGVLVGLQDGQQLSGRLLGLDKETLTLRTAWADRLTLPRAAVAFVRQPPGWLTVVEEDFLEGSKLWKVVGKPLVTDGVALLKRSGQELTFEPPTALEAGRVGVNFQERDSSGARWLLEAHFRSGVLRVIVTDGGDAYRVEAEGFDGVASPMKRSTGPHRLIVQFSPRSLRVLCDDAVLWHTREQTAGPLRRIVLTCKAVEKETPRGGVAWSEFELARVVDEPPRPAGEWRQDELWLAEGDQLFGAIVTADRSGIEIAGRFGKRTLPWSLVRGCYLRRAATPLRTTTGAHVRLTLRGGLDADEVLDGVLTALDKKRLTLRHALLGEVILERGWVRRLQPLLHGARIELDNGVHHFGDATRTPPGWPKAEGESWRGSVRLDVAPAEARLTLRLEHPPGGRDGKLEATINGRRVGFLEPEGGRWSVTLPRGALRAGENTIELKRAAGSMGLSGIALEVQE